MDSVSADDMEPAATQEMMKREIDKLRREIKDLEEDLKNEKKQRLRAEKELKDWKDMHDVVQDFRSAVGQWKNTMLVKHFPDPSPQEDTTTKSGCEQMDDFVQTKLLEWGLEEFLLIFEAEKIDKESFLLLDGSSLQTLIPFVGPRLKFQKHLKALLEEPNRETTECSFSQGPSTQQRLMMMMMVENGSLFNIREILCRTPEGNKLVTSLDENGLISVNERRSMVRMLVSHLLEACGENPTSDIKAALAASVVEQFPCLKDCQGSGYDAWYTPARKSKPATGFLEERLRNVRKRLHRGRPTDSTVTETTLPESPIILPEATISEEAAFHMTEWLKENMWPREQVTDYMQETAVYRAQWIRNNEAKTVPDIIAEFPRLVDTPGMLSRDFSILHPDKCSKLTERWNLLCAEKIICLAKKEKADLPSNVDNLSTERRGELALQLLPRLIPLAPYKVGKKVSRPSKRECQKAFIDEKPVGTNLAEYLSQTKTEYPFVLMLGDSHQCSQAFVIINGAALEHPSLLSAIDTCFKAFFVFNIQYPHECAQVWEFIQTVFEIPGPVRPCVKVMRAQFAM
ncbi:uncharacterized protein LOC134435017 isoform X2 [Engraulis encrasicolus]